MVFTVPAIVIVITPAQLHMHLLVLFRAGMPPIMTVGDPGVQGVVTGTHGIGVSTPIAAEVADATVGLASELHMPNGGMFTIGLKSMMFAAGALSALVRFTGSTIRLAGRRRISAAGIPRGSSVAGAQ